jgi:predicted double-glycine peptidase/8-oxo-dGTP pyrophosphatase MutT (NUDIX family)
MSLLRPEMQLQAAQQLYQLGKEAATTTVAREHALSGRLYLSQSGWLLLAVPNAITRGAFAALHEPGTELSPGAGDGPHNAHISVMNEDEVMRIGGGDVITERGRVFRYSLGQVRIITNPAGWSEMSKVWVLEVKSPELRELRRSYGLPSEPDGKPFHLSFAVRRRNVLQEGEVRKAAEEDRPIKVPLPFVRQGKNYTCGNASLEAVNAGMGGKPTSEQELEEEMGTTSAAGTSPEAIVAQAKELGLEAQLHERMTPEQLQRALDSDKAVICDIQAWGDPANYPKLLEGHYVAAVGYDETNYYFMDPSIDDEFGFIPKDEMGARWADQEGPEPGKGKTYRRAGIVIWKPGRSLTDEPVGKAEKIADSLEDLPTLARRVLRRVNPNRPLSRDLLRFGGVMYMLASLRGREKRGELEDLIECKLAELPYRDRVEAFGLNPAGKVLGGYYEDDKTHGVFGGGVDEGETPEQAAAREFREEAGYNLLNPRLLPVEPMTFDWKPPYDTPQQAERAKQFKGSRTFFAAGRVGQQLPEGAVEPSWLNAIRFREMATALRRTRPEQAQYPELAIRRRQALMHLLKERRDAARTATPQPR